MHGYTSIAIGDYLAYSDRRENRHFGLSNVRTRDVKAAGGDVSRHKDLEDAVSEALDGLIPLCLCHIPVQCPSGQCCT